MWHGLAHSTSGQCWLSEWPWQASLSSRQGRSGSLPTWLGYFSLVVAVCEFGQLPIFFFKAGPFSGNGAGAWYLATFTWGPWILAAGWAMYRVLGRQQAKRLQRPEWLDAGSLSATTSA